MVLHGGQAKLTKDKSSQVSQFMSSRPWGQFGTGHCRSPCSFSILDIASQCWKHEVQTLRIFSSNFVTSLECLQRR